MQTEWQLAESQLETRLRTWAIPGALAGAFLLVSTGAGRFLLRIFLSMWVHELGHASTAWLCGFPAFPGPWLTPMAESRSPFFGFMVFGAIAAGAFWAWRRERWRLCAALAGLLAVQLFCTVALSAATAKQLIVFMGDGGCLVLGSLLMLTVYAPEESALKRGWLRWGFLGIGAGAFVDVFVQWWASRTDFDRIPFGMNEGAGLSDPSVLSETFGWSTDQIVHRYVALGCVCLAVVAVAYLRGLARNRSED
ncbi:MAG: hypothetical protein E6J86_08750 [Deltaproteobacteria bacterium]|nr:MAG: hypothetical protein E6J86_08750 [Deltaproteobacteria bacterium]